MRYLGYFSNEICHQENKKIAQSGHTATGPQPPPILGRLPTSLKHSFHAKSTFTKIGEQTKKVGPTIFSKSLDVIRFVG